MYSYSQKLMVYRIGDRICQYRARRSSLTEEMESIKKVKVVCEFLLGMNDKLLESIRTALEPSTFK